MRFSSILRPVWMLLLAVSVGLPSVSLAQQKLKWAHVYEASEPYHTESVWAAEEIKKRSKGKFDIQVFPASSLGKETDLNQGLMLGSVDIMIGGPSFAARTYPRFGIAYYPFIFRDGDHLLAYAKSSLFQEMVNEFRQKTGIQVTAYTYYGARHTTANKTFNQCAEVKGLKIRVLRSGSGGRFVEATGAVPVALTHDRISAALQARIIDGMEVTLPSFTAARHHLLTKFYSLTEHSMTPAVVIFSKKIWDELSRSDQTIIRNAAKASVPIMREQWAKHEAAARRVAEAAGVKIIDDVDKQSFADLLRPLNSRLVPDPALQAVLKRIQAER